MEGVENLTSLFSMSLAKSESFLPLLLFFTLLIVVYSVFIYYFYRFLAKKNIIELNLNKYNKSNYPGIAKFAAIIFYILEYIIVLPIVTVFWFVVLSVLVLVLAKNLGLVAILTIAAALVASVRVTSYVSEKLSQDLAKMLPFILLGLAITDPTFFSLSVLLSRVEEIPALLAQIPYFLLFIIILEFAMRIFNLIRFTFFQTEKPQEEEYDVPEKEA